MAFSPPPDAMAVDEPPPKSHCAPALHGSPSEEHDDMVLDEPPPKHYSAPTSHGSPSLEEEKREEEEEEEVEVWVIDPPPPKPDCVCGGAGARHCSALVEQMKSPLDSQKLLIICRKFAISEETKYRAFCPEDGWGPCKTPPERSVCVYRDMLEVGVRFPLHDFYTKILRHYCIAPSQLTPNAWRYLVGFVLICDDAGVKPTVPVFRYYFKLTPAYGSKSRLQGWYCFTPYSTCRQLFIVDNGSRSYNGWKKFYFFLESRSAETAWRCPTKWGTPSEDSLKDPVLDDAATKAREKLYNRGKQSLQSLFSTCNKLPVLPTLETAPVKEEADNYDFARTSPPRKYRAMSSLMDPPPQQLAAAMASASSPPLELLIRGTDPERPIPVRAHTNDRDRQQHSAAASQRIMEAFEMMQRTEEDLHRVEDELQKEKSEHAADVSQLNKELEAAKAEHTAQVAKLSAEKAEFGARVRQLMEELNTEKSKAKQLAEDFRAAEVKAHKALRETCSTLVKTIEGHLATNYPITEPAIQTPPPGLPPHQVLEAAVTRVDFRRTIEEEVEAIQYN